jgi:hypothetical protein
MIEVRAVIERYESCFMDSIKAACGVKTRRVTQKTVFLSS